MGLSGAAAIILLTIFYIVEAAGREWTGYEETTATGEERILGGPYYGYGHNYSDDGHTSHTPGYGGYYYRHYSDDGHFYWGDRCGRPKGYASKWLFGNLWGTLAGCVIAIVGVVVLSRFVCCGVGKESNFLCMIGIAIGVVATLCNFTPIFAPMIATGGGWRRCGDAEYSEWEPYMWSYLYFRVARRSPCVRC